MRGDCRRWHPAGAAPSKTGASFHSLQFTVSTENAKREQIVWTSYCFCCSVTKLCLTLCDHMDCSAPGSPVLHYFLELVQIHVHWCHPTISSSVPSFSSCPQSFPASGSFQISQFFKSGGQSIGVYFNISLSNEHSGLISFRRDWVYLLAVQGTLKSLLQHYSSKASFLKCSAFFIVQLSHPYMTTGKTLALTRWTYDGKVMSLLLNMLSRLVITFLPRNKHLLSSWLLSPSTVICSPKK